jgi:hypothetical protein
MNDVIGKIDCPLCGNNNATVHAQKNRGNKKYFRCYSGEFGDCGTIQCTGVGGQRFIEKNMRSVNPVELIEVTEDAKQAAKESAIRAAKKGRPLPNSVESEETEVKPIIKKRSLLSDFFQDEKK